VLLGASCDVVTTGEAFFDIPSTFVVERYLAA
jgi:hypothetical protein